MRLNKPDRKNHYNKISIHALTRSATAKDVAYKIQITDFNPRTHEECDASWLLGYSRAFLFQSTHSRGVRLWSVLRCQNIKEFQSTHSRGVRRYRWREMKPEEIISIHALTRSATVPIVRLPVCRCYFNPRTHEECDPVFRHLMCYDIYFNPRTHEECDYHFTPIKQSAFFNFNPRTHEECDSARSSVRLA